MISLCDNSHIIEVQEYKKMCQRGDEEILLFPTVFNVLLIIYEKVTMYIGSLHKLLELSERMYKKLDTTADRDK